MHPLTEVIWLFNEEADEETCEHDVARLAALLDAEPSIDAKVLIGTLIADLGIVIPRAVALIRQANGRMSRRPPIDMAPVVSSVQSAKLDYVSKMEGIVENTAHLRRVLTPGWFEELRAIVLGWDGESTFELSTHTAFMGYYSDVVCYGGDFLPALDDAFERLGKLGSVKQKLKEIAGASAGYVSTAFEMLVLRTLAVAGCIETYEPRLPGVGKGEALVGLGGQRFFVEARVKMDEERSDGAFDPVDMGVKLFDKLQEKYATQYAGVTEPLVVFFSLGASVLQDIEAEAMIAEVMKDGAAGTLSAVVFCDMYQPRKMWLWCNPAATNQLTPEAVRSLFDLFPLHEFRKTGLI